MKKEHSNKFYVTTPIYYGTAKPHLGSLYSTLLADVASRWNKMQGHKTFFLTGTDEHGQKVVQAAQKAGMEPQEFVDSFIHAYKTIWHDYEFAYTEFIRTTDPEHKKAVQAWIKAAQKNVANRSEVESLIRKTKADFGRIDLLINNAGVCIDGEFKDMTLDHWKNIIDINLWGVIY